MTVPAGFIWLWDSAVRSFCVVMTCQARVVPLPVALRGVSWERGMSQALESTDPVPILSWSLIPHDSMLVRL